MFKKLILITLAVFLSGCAVFGTMERTNSLSPGMTIAETKKILGQPSQTQFTVDKLVLKYNLHQYFKGWVPCYLVFNRKTQKLESWFADEQEYYRTQQLWIETMPKQVDVNQNIHVQGNIHHDIYAH